MKEKITEFIKTHPYAVIGCAAGIIIAAIIMLAGFWGTLFILILGGFGLWLGISKDKGRNVADSLFSFATRIKDFFSGLFNR